MSSSADDRTDLSEKEALSDLETQVGRVLEEMQRLRERARKAERRATDAEALLRNFTTGKDDPAGLRRRMRDMEDENEGLRSRIQEGREGVERLLARIRFLEEQR